MAGLFATAVNRSVSANTLPSIDLINKLGCHACPLNKAKNLASAKMVAVGSDNPLFYVLGRAPFNDDDQEGYPFAGKIGEYVRPLFPSRLRKLTRWNNVVNCHPGDADLEKIHLEACRSRITADIEQTKPVVIFGLGGYVLMWADKPSSIDLWRGRRFPIKVGNHTCWYYSLQDPNFIISNKRNSYYKSDEEIAFQLDIKKALAEIEAGMPEPIIHTAEYARKDITCITGRSAKDLVYVLDFLEYAGSLDVVGVDYETQNLRPYYKDSCIVTKAVSALDETLSFAWRHPRAGWTGDALEKLGVAWVRFLKTPAKKAVHNLSFEMEWDCYYHGVDLAHDVPWEDTLTQAYILDERVGDRKPGALSLEFIALQYFGLNMKSLTTGMDKRNMRAEPLETLLPYNGIDAKYHRLCYEVQKRRIEDEGLTEVYQEKLAQVPTVVRTQIKGIPTKVSVTLKLEKEYSAKLAEIDARIQALPEATQFKKLTGRVYNPSSPQDVIVVLRDILKTRDGQEGTGWSTKESVLSKVDSPIAKGTLEHRSAVKTKSTYIDPYMPGSPDLYEGDILHPSFSTTFTETGRLSCQSPNIQNQPTRNAEAKKVRNQIQSVIMVSLDAGQIDARMIACGSRDKNYCKALWEDYDIHMEWAHRLAHHYPAFVGGKKFINDKDVMKTFRGTLVKNSWVFALFYGAALRTTAGRFKVDEATLKPMYEEFWKQFADVKQWQERLVKQFEEHGYVQMLGGQRRRAPLGRGQIVNTPVQNATNRIIMNGMNKLSQSGIWLLQPNMQIHDDITVLFNSIQDYEDNIERIVDTMLDCREFDWICVPLVVELKDGTMWGELKEVGTFSSVKRLGWPSRLPEFC